MILSREGDVTVASMSLAAWVCCGFLCAIGVPAWAQSAPETAPSAEAPAPAASSPEALNAYSQAATYQNNRAFDLGAEAWQKFLEVYPSDPKAIDAQYNLGVCQLEQKDFAAARKSLEQALAQGQTFSRREDAYLNLGWALYRLALQDHPELFPQAEQAFATLLAEYPQGQYLDQAWFLSGESLYQQGKRAEAAAAYEHLVQDHADSPLLSNGLYALGVTYEELGRFADAGAIYARFLDNFTDHALTAEVRMRKAETVLQQGDVATAEQQFAEVAQIPNFADADHARYRQAYCVARQERYADAAELFVALTRDFPQSRYRNDASIAAARAYYRAEQFAKAAEWFDRLLDGGGPAASEAAHWRTRLLLQEKHAEDALRLIDRFLPEATTQQHPFAANLRLDQADAMYELPDRKRQAMEMYIQLARDLTDHPLAPQALYNAAFAALELKEYRQAQQWAQDFLAKYADHRLVPDVKRIVAECQLQLGESARAVSTFAELADHNDNPAEAGNLQLRRAVALYQQHKYDETLALLTAQFDSLSTVDQRAEALHLMGMSYFGQQKFAEAKQALSESIELQPRWRQADETLLYLSQAAAQLGQHEQAKTAAARLLNDFPDSALADQATYRLAEACSALVDFAAAAEHYRAVVQRWPNSDLLPFSLYGWAWSELRRSAVGEAEQILDQLLRQYPKHQLAASAHYARALARQQAGRFEPALEDLRDYLATDPQGRRRSDGLYLQGLCLVGLKQLDRAIEVLRGLTAQDPRYEAGDKVLYELAWAYRSANQPQQALATFQQLADQYPDCPFAAEAFYHVAEAHYENAQYADALAAYEQARTRAGGSSNLSEKVRYKLGWAHYQLGQFPEAQAAFAEQVNVVPEGELAGDAYFMQAECLTKQGKYDEALRQYGQSRQRKLSSEQMATLASLHAGQAAAQLQRWQESLDWLAEATRKFPESPWRWQIGYELAVAQQNLGNLAEAERLFGSIADGATGELSARSRFMRGEVLYAQQDYVAAVREFRKVMFGFDPAADPAVASWQAKAGFEAGQCAGVLASQQTTRAPKQQYLELASRFYQYVQTRHPGTDEAAAATEQLKKYGNAIR
jgi:TolA-binding protein